MLSVKGTPRDRYAFVAVCALLFFEYARPQGWISAIGALHLPLLLGAGLFLWWLIIDRAAGLGDALIWPVIALLALAAISVPDAANRGRAFATVESLVITVGSLMIPLARLLRTPLRLNRALAIWVLALTSAGVHAMTHNGFGPGGFLGDENDLALAMVMLVGLAWYQMTNPVLTLSKRALYTAAVIIGVLAVVASNSRGGFLALVAVVGSIVWFSPKRGRAIFVALCLSLAALFAMPDEYVQEVQSIEDTEDSTRNDRLWSWKMAIEMWKDHPLFGVGISNYPWNVVDYELKSPEYDPESMRLHVMRVSHSLYFDLLAEFGIIGGGLYALLAWRVFHGARHAARQPLTVADQMPGRPNANQAITAAEYTRSRWAQGVAVALIGYLTAAIFISVEYYPHIFVLAGLTSALLAPCPRTRPIDFRIPLLKET